MWVAFAHTYKELIETNAWICSRSVELTLLKNIKMTEGTKSNNSKMDT